MSPIFFLTEKETLPVAVANRLLAGRSPEGGLLSFEDTLLPPRTGTLAGLTKGTEAAVATPLQSAAAWVETVLAAEVELVRQSGWKRADAGGRTDLGLGLYGLATETAKAGLSVAGAAGKIDAPEDAERWSAWAELERRYLRRLLDREKRCPQEAELARAADPLLPAGIGRVVLAGVVDASPLAVAALEALEKKGVPVEILAWAPGLKET
ncbi:MAG: hypothetical protein EBS49_07945, partial [Verrucomicrobia bacterium]|nr:hypothetical protein [Verrucomicrobiota bacterium]